MNLKQIENTISDYNTLIDLTKSKIKILENVDEMLYGTGNGVEKISFIDDAVSVRCDDSWRGCYDSLSFEFPIKWLSKSDDELEQIVTMKRELRYEEARQYKEEMALKQNGEKEKREWEQYQALKTKYEQ